MCDDDVVCVLFFFKQKTAYEMRISDWSSDVCSSDLMQTLNATQVRFSYFGVGIKQLFRCSVPEIELYEVAGFEGAFAQAEQSGPQGLTFDESITRHQAPLWQLVAGDRKSVA